jgi:hypothetical protein
VQDMWPCSLGVLVLHLHTFAALATTRHQHLTHAPHHTYWRRPSILTTPNQSTQALTRLGRQVCWLQGNDSWLQGDDCLAAS